MDSIPQRAPLLLPGLPRRGERGHNVYEAGDIIGRRTTVRPKPNSGEIAGDEIEDCRNLLTVHYIGKNPRDFIIWLGFGGPNPALGT